MSASKSLPDPQPRCPRAYSTLSIAALGTLCSASILPQFELEPSQPEHNTRARSIFMRRLVFQETVRSKRWRRRTSSRVLNTPSKCEKRMRRLRSASKLQNRLFCTCPPSRSSHLYVANEPIDINSICDVPIYSLIDANSKISQATDSVEISELVLSKLRNAMRVLRGLKS